MARVITFSRVFPTYHQRKGEPTFFIEKFWASRHVDFDYKAPVKELLLVADILFTDQPKYHTIREGNRWKVGDKFSPRVWSGRPYNSKQIVLAPDVEIKKIWTFEIQAEKKPERFLVNGTVVSEVGEKDWFNARLIEAIAKNDGLDLADFLQWFRYPKNFTGQIICWNDQIEY